MMKYFIDQSHGIDLTRLNGMLRVIDQVFGFVYFLGENTAGMKVRKNDIAIVGKKSFIELMVVACLVLLLYMLLFIPTCTVEKKLTSK
jgi:hypothetical protein